MDFTPNPEQQAVADVVTSVLERDNSWDALVSGGVTALAVPERLGGDGLGLAEVATALTEIGRRGTVSPALATLGLGLVPLLDLASEAQQDRYLAQVDKGAVLSAALSEPGGTCRSSPRRPSPVASSTEPKSVCRTPDRRSGSWSRPTPPWWSSHRPQPGDADQDPDGQRLRRVRGDVRRRRRE